MSTNCIDSRRVVQKLRNIKPVTLFTTHGDNIVPYFHSIKQDNLLQELPHSPFPCADGGNLSLGGCVLRDELGCFLRSTSAAPWPFASPPPPVYH